MEDGKFGKMMILGLGLVMTKVIIYVEAIIMIDARAMIMIDAWAKIMIWCRIGYYGIDTRYDFDMEKTIQLGLEDWLDEMLG